MANTQLQQWIIEKIKDNNWGSHHKVKIWSPETGTWKEADWLWKYANRKAIIIEDKEEKDVDLPAAISQVRGYEKLINNEGYDDVITIAVKDKGIKKVVKVYRNDVLISEELKTLSEYETLLGAKKQIDISKEIYNATAKINQLLHDEFKITHLQDRMLFTGCILVASKQSSGKFENFDSIEEFKQFVINKITSIETNRARLKALKINQLTSLFSSINIGASPNKQLIGDVCEICNSINENLKNNPLTDIDIMNIFFTEFNRYRGKSESGQVFTPDHIAGLMADLLDIKVEDKILDPCCGSGSLLLASSRLNNKNFNNIFGNDNDMNVLRLSYINMLLHNDGITNLEQMDARDTTEKSDKNSTQTFIQWIKTNKITKVIANPPYEKTFAIDILENVISSVEDGCRIVWLMPNTKMDKKKKSRKILEHNTLSDIILLGDIFPKTGTGDVSLFIFTKGIPQGNTLIKCWSINDGFETVKNQGYQDVKGNWPKIKQDFLEKFREGKFDKEIDPKTYLSYQKDIEIQRVTQEDIDLNLLQYKLYEQGVISSKNTVLSTLKLVLDVAKNDDLITKHNETLKLDDVKWGTFKIHEIFVTESKGNKKQIPTGCYVPKHDLQENGETPRITVTDLNNGIFGYYNYGGSKSSDYRVFRNFISVSFLGSMFYQKNEASLDMKVHCLKIKGKELNKNLAIFLISCIKSSLQYSSYGDQVSSTVLPYLEFKLPVDEHGKPHWDFMNNYLA